MFFLPAELVKEAGNEVFTLNGEPRYESGRQFHASSHDSVFLLLQTVQQFSYPHPLVSYCEEFSPVVHSNSVIVMLIEKPISIVQLHCRVADKMRSVCDTVGCSEPITVPDLVHLSDT